MDIGGGDDRWWDEERDGKIASSGRARVTVRHPGEATRVPPLEG